MKHEQTLSRRFTLSSSIVLTVLLVAVFSIMFFSNENDVRDVMKAQETEMRDDYQSKGELLANLASKITPEWIMAFDMVTLKTMATQVLADEDVIKVDIIDTTGKPILALEEKALSDSSIVIEREIKTDPAKLGVEQKVGTLRITIDQYKLIEYKKEQKESAFKNSVGMIIWFSSLIIILNVLIAVTINIILKKVVISPIRHGIDLVDAVAEHGDISIDVDSQFLAVERSVEIDNLAEAMKKLVNAEKDVVKLTTAMANGVWNQLPVSRSDKDALNHSLRVMIENVNETLLNVRMMALQVSSVSQQLSDSGQDLSSGASDQSQSINTVIAAISLLSTETESSADKARGAREYSETVNRNAATGNRQMNELNSAMEDIRHSSDSIKKIIKTIDDIAFQTNLLALNAAVEAARAGQHGKGFAVVADEVRNLASRSAQAAQETATLIENSNLKVQNGITIAAQTGVSLKEIVGGVDKINNSLEEIANAAVRQVGSIQEIKGRIGTIESVTQRTASTAQETAAMAEELSSQAQMLNDQLARFELSDDSDPVQSVPKKQNQVRGSQRTSIGYK